MTVDGILVVYIVSVLAALSGVAIYSELRRRSFGPTPTEDHIFRCEKCGYVYTDDPDVDRSRCPQCGAMNDVFSF
jgi:rubrerythrin